MLGIYRTRGIRIKEQTADIKLVEKSNMETHYLQKLHDTQKQDRTNRETDLLLKVHSRGPVLFVATP